MEFRVIKTESFKCFQARSQREGENKVARLNLELPSPGRYLPICKQRPKDRDSKQKSSKRFLF